MRQRRPSQDGSVVSLPRLPYAGSSPYLNQRTAPNSVVGIDLKSPATRHFVKPFYSRALPRDQLGKQERWYNSPVGKASLRRSYWSFLAAMLLGVAGAAAIVVTNILSLPHHEYCLVLDEQFDGPSLDTSIWSYEQQVGGFQYGEFEWTTTSPNNSFIEDGKLYIVPTLTADAIGTDAITNGYLLNLTASGVCTSIKTKDCVINSNSTVGNVSVIPPAQSARITTKLSKSIRYGRVEVSVRMPTGSWIWPSIFMKPLNSVYGPWPMSGEIDIVQSKGNPVTSPSDNLANAVTSSLHWGVGEKADRFAFTTTLKKLYNGLYTDKYYKFGLEWDEKRISTWRQSQATEMFTHDFTESFWKFGKLAGTNNNTNPWSTSANTNVAPFDEDFYLVLSVAVGGTSGYFPDGEANKPWGNGAIAPALDFWDARNTWYPSWGTDMKKRGMAVDYVKMWSIKDKGATCA